MQKRNRVLIYIASVILIALTVCGSFLDYEIANAVYIGQTPSENIIPNIFSEGV